LQPGFNLGIQYIGILGLLCNPNPSANLVSVAREEKFAVFLKPWIPLVRGFFISLNPNKKW
jgi:hypothetical protein